MSIDFDSAALQTQHDEDEYDQEDYAREQELHKLLTDLPDDMLEDSRDSSPELECSTCSNKNTGNSSHPTWTPQCEWTDQPRPPSNEEDFEVGYKQGSDHNGYVYEDAPVNVNHHGRPAHSQTWNQQLLHGGYTHTNTSIHSSADHYETEPCPHIVNPVEYDRDRGGRNMPTYGNQDNTHNHLDNFDYGGSEERTAGYYKATYKPACQPIMFNSNAPQQEGHFDPLQREFLDSAQDSADGQQLAQLQILHKAQQRKTEDLEQKIEDSRRNMRYLEHQFAIVKDEKDGLAVSLKEASRLLEEAKEREAQMQNKTKSLEQQVKALTERDHENLKKQRLAEAAVDSIKQQMAELRRSDALSRPREQHDRDITALREQHQASVLALQQQLDACDQALKEQDEAAQRLREQVKQQERQREEEQVERAMIINTLSRRLEESQQQCAKLLQTGSVQEISQMQIKLQQAQSAKALSENMNKALQEDLADLKEQITLYESAVKHGVVALDLGEDWENHLSESYVDLGIKKANWKNGRVHRALLDPRLPKEEALLELRAELQRCLASLKGKRHRMSQLQEELSLSQARAAQLQTQLDESLLRFQAKESSQVGHLDMTVASQKELLRLQEDKQHLEEKVEALENNLKELRQSEDKVKSANSELCTKMREMIHELDQEKQEAAERYEHVQRQCRDDAVKRVRTELILEHQAAVDELNVQYQQHITLLQGQLSEASDKTSAVQECYISVCKEKDTLEGKLRDRDREEALNVQQLREESAAALATALAELQAQHRASMGQMRELCYKELEAEHQQQLSSHLASAKATWEEERTQMERAWAQRLEEASRARHPETAEASCGTDEDDAGAVTVTAEELEARLSAQKTLLQLEADATKHKAAEEARRQAQRELRAKHLEDMANQVEGAVTRAYSRWLEDLTSLPEYKANLQRERDQWEELQKTVLQQQVSQALSAAEEQWRSRHTCRAEEPGAGAQRSEELQDEVASLRSQQAALLTAELAAARAAWTRDRQQELSSALALSEQRQRELRQSLHKATQEAELQRAELLLRSEAELQRVLRAREEQEQAGRWRDRQELMAELQAGLAELQAQLPGDAGAGRHRPAESPRSGTASTEGSVAHDVLSACRDALSKALSQASRQWTVMSEERLSHALKENQERHEQEVKALQISLSQRSEEAEKQCSEEVAVLQKKIRELQRHLEKACRQLQHTVRDNKATVQRLRDEYEDSLRKAKESHLLQLEEERWSKEPPGRSNLQQSVQLGLEEMKEQYMTAVEKIRGDMLRYLQESKERAAEMIRVEVQRERQNTARTMRRYYLTCLQELLEDGGQPTGAEKKIMSAAGKLAAMAKVLETPIKSRPEKSHSPSINAVFSKNLSSVHQVPETRPDQKIPEPVIPVAASGRCISKDGEDEAGLKGRSSALTQPPSCKPPRQPAPGSQVSGGSVRARSREAYLQGAESDPGCLQQRKALVTRDVPVRDQGRGSWRAGRNHDANTGFQLAALPHTPSSGLGGFGSLTPDMTVYNEIAKLPPHSKTSREPVPGSEGDRRNVTCANALFSELQHSQQDGGFDSPFSQPT